MLENYAKLPHTYDAWKHLATGGCFGHDFYEDDPDIFPGIRDGIRTDRIMADVYDAEMAEIHHNRKDAMRNRRRDRRNHPENPETRKKEKQNRNHRMYGNEVQWAKFKFNPEDPQWCRGGWCWDWNPEGKKNPCNPEMDVIRNRRKMSAVKSIAEDWELEQANHADAMAEYYDLQGHADWHFAYADESKDPAEQKWERNFAHELVWAANYIYADEEYFRKGKSFGVRADIYVGKAYQNRK